MTPTFHRIWKKLPLSQSLNLTTRPIQEKCHFFWRNFNLLDGRRLKNNFVPGSSSELEIASIRFVKVFKNNHMYLCDALGCVEQSWLFYSVFECEVGSVVCTPWFVRFVLFVLYTYVGVSEFFTKSLYFARVKKKT